MADEFDLAVIGGGSGGLACAQRAAEYGARVVLVESGRLGGTCVNVGCVPKKVMWNAAAIAEALHDGPEYGFSVAAQNHDWPLLRSKRDEYVVRLNSIYERNLAKRQVELVRGHARFNTRHSVEVGGRTLSAPHIVVATGGKPLWPAIPGAELGISSDGFFQLPERPERVAVVGSGYIAVELAGIFAALGSRVTLATRGVGVLKNFDAMLGEGVLEGLREQGVEVVPNAWPHALERAADGALALTARFGAKLGPFDCVLWAIGRASCVEDLSLSIAHVDLDAYGFIATDKYQQTSASGIYAIGDVTGRLPLTPVAIAAGRRLSDRLFGGMADRHLDYDNIPTVIFSHPPVGTVGISEAAARELYGDTVQVFATAFVPLYHAMTTRKPRTRMKLITIGPEQRIVGAHVIGPGADEMLQGFAVAVRMRASKRDFDDTVAIHPTSAEELVTMR